MPSQIYKEVNLRHGIPSLPSCLEGWVLSPFIIPEKCEGWRHKLGRTSQVCFYRMVLLALRHLLGYGTQVWETVTWMSSYLVMALSALLCFAFSLYVNYIWLARWKPAPQSESNCKGKTQRGKQWQGGYCPISAPVTRTALPRGSAVRLTV